MNMQLSKDREHLVLNNQKLVHYWVYKWGVTVKSSNYEDLVSIGTIGLVKAAITFDESKGIKFTTYAGRCIDNELSMNYKKSKKHENNISLYEVIGKKNEEKEFTFVNKIANSESDFVEKIEDKDAFIKTVEIILNCLTGKYKLAILYQMAGANQQEIGKIINVSQSFAGRVEKTAIKKIQEIASKHETYKKIIFFNKENNEYIISFSADEISKHNKNVATFLQDLTLGKKVANIRVKLFKNRIIIRLPANSQSFVTIAKIIQEIDNLNAKPVFNNHNVNAEKQVRDYILSLNSFTYKELLQHFPNFSVGTIKNAISRGKKNGVVTSTSRGKYIVNQNKYRRE